MEQFFSFAKRIIKKKSQSDTIFARISYIIKNKSSLQQKL